MSQTQKSDGMNYAPQGKPSPVVKPGEFAFAAAHLDHGHIYGQCNGLLEAGGELRIGPTAAAIAQIGPHECPHYVSGSPSRIDPQNTRQGHAGQL